jgi:hypothetical protein
MLTERLALLISADVQGAVRGLNEVGQTAKSQLGEAEKRIDKVGRGFSKVGAGMMAVGGAAAVGLYKTVDAASDLEQAVGGTEAVFKDASKVIDKYAKDAAENAGLSERAFREATTSIGGNLKRMGFDVDDAAKQSAELTQVAADLAATYGGTTAEAVAALGAAFRGEADPAERFNLNLKASAVNAKAVEMGLAATTSAVDEQARAQALLALITEQSADALGQFGRESDSASGSAQIAAAKFEEAKAALGESLAPVMADVAGLASTLLGGFSDLNEATDGLASKVVAGSTGFLLIGGAISSVIGRVISMRENFGAAISKMRDLMSSTDGATRNFGRLGTAIAGIGTAIAVIEIARRTTESFADKLEGIHEKAGDTEEGFDALSSSIKQDAGEIGNFTRELIAARLEAAGLLGVFADAGITMDEYVAAVQRAVAAGGDQNAELAATDAIFAKLTGTVAAGSEEYINAASVTGVLVSQVGSAKSAMSDLEAIGGPTADVIGDVGDEADGAKKPVKEYSTGIEDAIKPHEDLENAIKGVTDALRAQFDPLFAAQDALYANQDAQRAVEQAEKDAKKAQDDLNGAVYLYGKQSPEAKDAADRLADAQRNVDDANRTAARSALDVTTASTELAAQMRAGNIDIAAAENQIRLWADQGLITEQQARQMKDELNLAALAAHNLDGTNVVVDVTADTTKFWKAIADLYSGAAGVPLGMGDVGGPLIVPEFNKAEGGYIPGPKGKPVFGIAHGGEYVVSNAELDAMNHAGISPSTGGLSVTIERMDVRNQPTEDSIVTELRRQSYLWMN